MTEIKDVKVYDLEECIIASGYAMRLDKYNYSDEKNDNLNKHIDRCKKLVKASLNTDVHCHDNFLTGIRVSFDIKYPEYLSPEMQRYHFFDIVTSMSKMHKLLKLDIKKSCNKYVNQSAIDNILHLIDNYNSILNDPVEHTVDYYSNAIFKGLNGETYKINNKEDALYVAWMQIISNCPLGLELWMRVSTNYKQLQTIYYQRRHHKLKEDWNAIIKMIEELPYFDTFILGESKPKSPSPSINHS